jgi:hypothetical protein
VGATDFIWFLTQYQLNVFIWLGQVYRRDFKLDIVADNEARRVHLILGTLTAAEDRTTLKCEHVKSVKK